MNIQATQYNKTCAVSREKLFECYTRLYKNTPKILKDDILKMLKPNTDS